jgi:hypothetical protein
MHEKGQTFPLLPQIEIIVFLSRPPTLTLSLSLYLYISLSLSIYLSLPLSLSLSLSLSIFTALLKLPSSLPLCWEIVIWKTLTPWGYLHQLGREGERKRKRERER